jgi:hypothetical protein
VIANLTENLSLIAAIAALGAWWVSWREARRNNTVIVKLKRFSSVFTQNQAGTSCKLEVWIVNRGIQLQNISMFLWFHGPGGSGTVSIPIPLSEHSKGVHSTFLRGTTASFVLSASDKKTSDFLSMLSDIKEQRPVINLFNSSFLSCSFPIYSRWDRLKKLWNRLSFKFRFTRRVGEGCNGKGVFKSYQLPYFEIRSEQLQFFMDSPKAILTMHKQLTNHNVDGPVVP